MGNTSKEGYFYYGIVFHLNPTTTLVIITAFIISFLVSTVTLYHSWSIIALLFKIF